VPRTAVLLVVALCAALLAAAPAQAANVTALGSLVVVSTAPGDADTTLTVTRATATATEVTVTESGPGAALTGGGTCTVAANTATCAVPADVELSADLQANPDEDRILIINGPLAGELNGGAGTDLIRGGALADTIQGGPGNDTLRGGDSPTTPDYLSGNEGDDTLDGENGNDRMAGGPGGDTIRDTSTQETLDVAEYFSRPGFPDEFRTTGVTVTLDGVRNDGSAEDGPLRDNVEQTVTSITGTELADDLTGGSGPNRILGYGGDDVLTGLGGADELSGQLGSDTLHARDGERDATIDCNNSDLSRGTGPNTAIIDGALESATDCTDVDTGLGAGETPGGGGNPGGGGGGATPATPLGGGKTPVTAFPKPVVKVVEPFPVGTVTMPDFTRGTRICGAKRGWCTAAMVKARLDSRRVNARYEIKEATAKALEAAADRDVEIGEVLYTDPQAGEKFATGPSTQEKIRIYEFAPKTLAGCNLERPFVRVAKRLYRLTDYLKGMTPRRAEETLEDLGCARSKWEIVDKVSTKVKDVTLTSVRVVKRRVELTVTAPAARLRLYDVNPKPGAGVLPPVFTGKGELALPDQPFRIAIRPLTETGVGFTNVEVVLRDSSGVWQGGNVTNADGVAAFVRREPLKPGNYELWAHACDADGDCVVGTRHVDVVKIRKDRQYLGLDGKTYGASGTRARAAQAGEVDAQKAQLGQVIGQIVAKAASSPLFIEAQRRQPAGEVAQAVKTLNAAANTARGSFAGYYDALIAAGVEVNAIGGAGGVTSIGPGSVVNKTGVISDGRRVATATTAAVDVGGGTLTLKVGRVLIIPGGMFYVADGGGKALGTPARVKVDVTSPKLDLVPLAGAIAVGMHGTGGAASLIGQDGASLIGQDGSTLIGMDGGTLVGMDGGTLIGMDGSTLIGNDGSTLIGMDGGTLVAAGGGNLVAAGGGN